MGPQHGRVGQAHLGDGGGTRCKERSQVKRLEAHGPEGDGEEAVDDRPSPGLSTPLPLFSQR